MSTSRVTANLVKSRVAIAKKIETVKSKAEAKILAYESEIKSIDNALHALSGDISVRKSA